MKKLLLVCIIVCSLFTSCASLMSDLTNTPIYNANVYSSIFTQEAIDINGKVLIVCDTGDSILQLSTESALVSAFAENNIEAVSIASVSINMRPDSLNEVYQAAFDNNCRYVLIIAYNDFYTYEYGGGISTAYFEATVDDLEQWNIPIRINGVIACEENKFLSYVETMAPACEEMATSIAGEYMKYVESTTDQQ